MIERDLELAMPSGVVDAVFFSPEQENELPGVLHLPDIGSIRDAQRQMARRLSEQGYAVLMPNPFYRSRRPPVFDFPRKIGEPRTMQRFAELVRPLTPEAQEQDALAYVGHLLSQPGVRRGHIGVVGYCFGGAFALRIAATCPDEVSAMASFHGGNLYKADNPDSPHLLLPRVHGRLYFGHAIEDTSMTADDISHFEEALARWGGTYESETYEGARHGWTVPDNPVFNPAQSERAFAKLTSLLAEVLR